MNLKRKKIAVIIPGVCIAFAVSFLTPHKADSRIVTNVPADVSGDELKAIVIDDFETGAVGEKGWTVKSTPKQLKNSTNLPKDKYKKKNPVEALEIKFISGSPNDLAVEEWSLTDLGKKKEKCLGIFFRFKYPGPNSVHIIPPPEVNWKDKSPALTYDPSTRTRIQDNGIQLPGRSRGISVWVHGRGNPYKLECWVKDYKGNTHILKFGSIDFVGWRPLKVEIPAYIPQEATSFPITRITKITRFVVRAEPDAKPGDVYVFLDQLKVLTDTFEVNFDGQELHKQFSGKASKPAAPAAK